MTSSASISAKQPHSTHPKYRADIDGLRAIAVLSVVGYHAFPIWFKGGFVGVDVFFVISGFLISSIIYENLDKGTFSFSDFYSRRIKRIFPALIVVLISCFSFGWFALLADEYKQLGKHIAAGTGFISNLVLWHEAGYFDKAVETKPLLHLWSLGIEEQFYIIWPMLLWLAWKKRFNRLSICLFLIAISFVINVSATRIDTVGAFYSPLARFWELTCGSLLAYFTLNKNSQNFDKIGERISDTLLKLIYSNTPVRYGVMLRNAKAIIGILLIAVAVLLINKEMRFPGWWAILPTFGTFLILSSGPHAWLNRNVLSNRVLVWFGLISYPLYLWHWPLLSFMRIIEGGLPSRNIRIAAVIGSIVLAWCTYMLIEKPIRSREYGGIKVGALCFLMTVIGLSGFTVYKREGLPFRAAVKNYKNYNDELTFTPEVDDACKKYVSNQSPLFQFCRFNDVGGHETIALIGDSHAEMAFSGIAEIASTKNINTVALANYGDCPSLLGATRDKNESEIMACNKRTEQLINTVKSKENIHKVFIFTRGAIYISGQGFGEAAAGSVSPLAAISPRDASSPDDVLKNSLQATINSLRMAGKDVYYVLENPELWFEPAACIARPLRHRQKNCDLAISVVLERQARYRKIISGLKNVKIIDSVAAFCPQDKCSIFKNGELLYADANHLSVSGSRFQAQKVLLKFLFSQ